MLDRDALRAGGALVPTRDPNRWLLHVLVQPGAKRTEAVGLHGDRWKVRLAAPPVDGKANAALLAWVAEVFGLPRASVLLTRGDTSRQKTVELHGLS